MKKVKINEATKEWGVSEEDILRWIEQGKVKKYSGENDEILVDLDALSKSDLENQIAADKRQEWMDLFIFSRKLFCIGITIFGLLYIVAPILKGHFFISSDELTRRFLFGGMLIFICYSLIWPRRKKSDFE